jgi:hypothetical protein
MPTLGEGAGKIPEKESFFRKFCHFYVKKGWFCLFGVSTDRLGGRLEISAKNSYEAWNSNSGSLPYDNCYYTCTKRIEQYVERTGQYSRTLNFPKVCSSFPVLRLFWFADSLQPSLYVTPPPTPKPGTRLSTIWMTKWVEGWVGPSLDNLVELLTSQPSVWWTKAVWYVRINSVPIGESNPGWRLTILIAKFWNCWTYSY